MKRWVAVVAVEVVVVLLGVGAAVWSWHRALADTTFAAAGRVPEFVATRYLGSWILLAVTLVVLAGLFAIDAVARVLRGVGAGTR
ncbi:hypothetical protein [Nocardia callitridis]|uniref:Uncharacterized protein n=1 Tax=Nocardia callitridis TaxID=648753 RepID=A0ABP9KXE8_9NOCA